MKRYICLLSFYLIMLCGQGLFGNTLTACRTEGLCIETQDTIDKQILYNGRIWRNNYLNITGNQFLFSNEFLPGIVTIDGKTFNGKNLRLKFNIYDDELLTVTNTGTVLQLNKEMVDRFTLEFENKLYRFKKLEADSLNVLSGYVQVLHDGATSLFVKYKKEIRLRNSVGENDTFLQSYRIYVMKDGIVHKVNNKTGFIRILGDKKEQVNNFLRSNHIHISRKVPDSFAPALEFYDSLR
jgi:hypothetical protein